MKALIGASVKRPIATLMFFLTVSLLGTVSASRMRIDFLPAVVVPKLTVLCSYGGLPAAEVRQLVTIPLEDSLSSLKGLKGISSVSRDGLAVVELDFHWGVDMAVAGVETREAIDLAFLSLPDGADKPQVLPVDPADEPVMVIGVFPKNGDQALARRLAEREIKTALHQAPGVGTVQITGGLSEEIHVEVDQARSSAYGLTIDAVARSLAAANAEFPAGSVTQGPIEYIVKASGKASTWRELEDYLIPGSKDGRPLRLREIAEVRLGYEERRSIFQGDGRDGVALYVRKKSDASPIQVAGSVRTALSRLSESFESDLELTVIEDRSIAVAESISSLLLSALLGSAIAFIIMVAFLGNLVNSLLLVAAIPVSILISLFLLGASGRTLNVMSIGGLAMGIGMLVDNSVVVMELLSRESPRRDDYSGIADLVRRVAGSLLGSTATSLVVFLPMLLLPGLLGMLFTDLALAVMFALAASLLVALFLVPTLYRLFSGVGAPKVPRLRLERSYRAALRLAFRRPGAIGIFSALVMAGGFAFLYGRGAEFAPALNEHRVEATVQMPPGTTIAEMDRLASSVYTALSRLPAVSRITCSAGGEPDDAYYLASKTDGPETLRVSVLMNRKAGLALDRSRELVARSLTLGKGEVAVSPPPDRLGALLGVRSGLSQWSLLARTPEALEATVDALLSRLGGAGGSRWRSLPEGRKPYIRLKPDRQAMAQYGLDIAAVGKAAGDAVYGAVPFALQEEGYDVPVRVRLPANQRSSEDALKRLVIQTAGGPVRLGDAVAMDFPEQRPALFRQDRSDVAYLTLAAKPTQEDSALLRSYGARPDVAGVLEENARDIGLVFALALALLYLVMGMQFESFSLPLILLATLPLAFSGVGYALFFCGGTVNLYSFLGIIVLMGTGVNNAIILYEVYRDELAEPGTLLLGALYRGSARRVRAIAISTLTTVLALVPLAIDPLGTSSQSPLAQAIIGGMGVSTLLALFVLPLLFRAYLTRRLRV